jgi:hypothetical protein
VGNLSGVLATQDSSDIPVMKTGLSASSGNVANATATASLPAKVGQIAYMTSWLVAASGATAGATVNLTVTGLAGGTLTVPFTFPAGANVAAYALTPTYYPGLQAAAANTPITISLPAGGAGNTNAAVSVQGFYLDAGY